LDSSRRIFGVWRNTARLCSKRLSKKLLFLSQIFRQFFLLTIFFFEENKHYITLFVFAETEGEAKLMKPGKCEEWKWFEIHTLPSPLFLPLDHLIKEHGSLVTLVEKYYYA
jgi:hypothetical protein